MIILLMMAMIFGEKSNTKRGFYIDTALIESGLVKEYELLAKDKSKDIVVTLDLPFYVLGQLIDESIYELEDKILYERIVGLLKHILKANRKYKYTKCIRAKEGALLVDAYIKIPLYFLTHDKTLLDRNVIKEEIELIKNAKGIYESPVFRIKEDYSQYKPRSHYTRTKKMQNYFRAVMYLGRMGFYPFSKKETTSSTHIAASLIISSIITNNPKIKKEYIKITKIIDEIIGKSDDLSPIDFIKIVKGYNVIPSHALCSASFDDKIKEGLKVYGKPGIYSTIISDLDTPSTDLISIKLFGQRWIFDSYVFQQLVYNNVGTRDKPRLMPRGLDVQAVLGSENALSILTDIYEEDRFKNYLTQMEKLRKLVDKHKDSIFNLSLYHNFIGIQHRYLLTKKESPLFTYNEELYETKKLITNLSAWALLKHATILYGKQSYTIGITSMPSKNLKRGLCIVEPYPNIINDMRTLTARLERITDKLKVSKNLKELDKLLEIMLKVALDERNGLPTQEKMDELRIFLKNNALLIVDDKSLDIPTKIADVHSDPNSGKVLEVATGYPLKIVYNLSEDKTATGLIMSYYEFEQNINDRLSDSQWKELLKKKKVEMPKWILNLINNSTVNSREF